MSPTPPPPPPLYTLHAQAVLKDSCIQKPFGLHSDTVTLHPQELMSTESRLQCWRPTGESRGAAADPRGGGGTGRGARQRALEQGEGFHAHPAHHFPHSVFFSLSLLLAGPVIAYRLFTQDGGATWLGAAQRQSSSSFPILAALYFALFHPPPGQNLLFAACLPSLRFSPTRFFPPSVLTPDSSAPLPASHHPLFLANRLDGGQVRASAGLRGAEGMRATPVPRSCWAAILCWASRRSAPSVNTTPR